MPQIARSRAPELLEAALFKPIGDGFLLRAAGVWPFVRARHYLVNQAEKDAILERLRRYRTRGVLLAFALWLFLVAAATALLAVLTRHDDPTIPDFLILFGFAVISILLCLQAQTAVILRPVTVGLTETSERFPARERLQATRSALRHARPFRQALPLAVLYSVACAANVFAVLLRTHGTRSSAFRDGSSFSALFLALLFGGLAVRFFYLDFAGSRTTVGLDVEAEPETSANPLTLRLEQVEAESRRLRRTLASVSALACLLGIGAAATAGLTLGGPTHSTEAGRFILRNSAGGIAALLATGKDNSVSLSLYGPDKGLRMFLGLTGTGAPQIAFYGPEEALRLVVGIAGDGLPVVRLNGADAKQRVGVVVNSNDSWLTLSDPGGTTRLSLSASPAGGHIRVLDADGKEQGHE